jgi:hypothetical protein
MYYGYEYAIYHHGILGQRWGIRRFQNRDGSLTAAGRKRYDDSDGARSDTDKEDNSNKKFHLTDKQKKAIKIGIAVAGTALAAYGAYRLIRATDATRSADFDIEKGILKKNKKRETLVNFKDDDGIDASKLKDAFVTNGSFGPISKSAPGRSQNCTMCSATFDLRQRGYNVRAGKSLYAIHEDDMLSWYKGGKQAYVDVSPTAIFKHGKKKYSDVVEEYQAGLRNAQNFASKDPAGYKRAQKKMYEQIVKQIESHGPNARGEVTLHWDVGGGHAVAWSTDKHGRAIFHDAQSGISGTMASSDFISQSFNHVNPFSKQSVIRLDNLEPDFKKMAEDGVFKNNRSYNDFSTADKAFGVAGAAGAIAAKRIFKSLRNEKREASKQIESDQRSQNQGKKLMSQR